jgi:hypothetical protein
LQAVNHHRDTYSYVVSNADMLAYLAVASGESEERVRTEYLGLMREPCGPPPPDQDYNFLWRSLFRGSYFPLLTRFFQQAGGLHAQEEAVGRRVARRRRKLSAVLNQLTTKKMHLSLFSLRFPLVRSIRK